MRFCWKCGLAKGEPDLAGCTMDILSDHEYISASMRPYQGLTFEEVAARYGRARLKARSAQAAANHYAVCPALSSGQFELELYRQKTIKRTRLAEALWAELNARIDSAADGLATATLDEDNMATADELASMGRDPGLRDTISFGTCDKQGAHAIAECGYYAEVIAVPHDRPFHLDRQDGCAACAIEAGGKVLH